jgi:hypothetical protein
LGDATPFTKDERLEKIARQIVNLIVDEKLNDEDTLRICISVTAYLAAIAGVEGTVISETMQVAIEEHKRVFIIGTMPRA